MESRHQWIEEPVNLQWRTKNTEIVATLRDTDELYRKWNAATTGPFYPFSDAVWLKTCKVLRDVGLRWLTNNLNLPEEVNPSLPFQTKHFERQAVVAKSSRVDDGDALGYVCNWSEGNLYAIRALQQELRRQRPMVKPMLVARYMDHSLIRTAASMFGLELLQLADDCDSAKKTLTRLTSDKRPIIFAATLANDRGQGDDLCEISELSHVLPLVLHVDASRNFDFVTSLSAPVRQKLGVPRLTLRHPNLDEPSPIFAEVIICAATIVAAGMNCTVPPPVMVLKPRDLGSPFSREIEYLKGSDNTLGGSRDAIASLLVCLQEQSFGVEGLREIYGQCITNRQYLYNILTERKIPVQMARASLDMIVYPTQSKDHCLEKDWALVRLDEDKFLLSIQPSVTARHVKALAQVLCGNSVDDHDLAISRSMKPIGFPLSDDVYHLLRLTVKFWHRSARWSGGDCLNQATYSALGPVLGSFLPVSIPLDWTMLRGAEILEDRKRAFGLSDGERDSFSACFTTGSTMGNRVGLHTALASCPNAFVYYSTVTHYSVKKIVSDSGDLKDRWGNNKMCRFAEIPADELGQMIFEGLVKQVSRDKALCEAQGRPYEIILLANIGTTFGGGRDNVLQLRQALRDNGQDVAYVHADGALDFGFPSSTVYLGRPELMTKSDLPVVQGITLSHHKAFGIMVSGEVICFSPAERRLATVFSSVEPRVIFETWFFQKM